MKQPPFRRTLCACDEDVANCKKQPGMLMPSDLAPIITRLQVMGLDYREQLRASPGAVFARITEEGVIGIRIPTIVPATQPNGRCTFLTEDDLCKIHDVAPAGCAFFDVHQDKATADERSMWIHQAIAEDDWYARFRSRLRLRVV